jgi:hypothetical protein
MEALLNKTYKEVKIEALNQFKENMSNFYRQAMEFKGNAEYLHFPINVFGVIDQVVFNRSLNRFTHIMLTYPDKRIMMKL